MHDPELGLRFQSEPERMRKGDFTGWRKISGMKHASQFESKKRHGIFLFSFFPADN